MPVDRVALPDALVIDLRQLVMTIASAVDLVGVDDVLHGRRVGLLARELAIATGLGEADQVMLYDAGLLHDCGVSSTRVHRRLVVDLEWEGAGEHCLRGAALLGDFQPLAHLAPIVRHHHTRWQFLLNDPELPPEVALHANLIHLADRIDVLAAPHHAENGVLAHVGRIRDRLAAESGRLFAPRLVDAFVALCEGEAFWLALQPDSVHLYQTEMEAFDDPRTIDWGGFRHCADILARIIDAKSSYTERHSRGVARLARHVAERMGLDPVTCEKIEVAGLLHDIGKLQVPDEIIEGTTALSDHEFDIMKGHSYGTRQVLRRLPAIDDIARWAAYHHETPDGRGYPYHLRGDALPLEARIINVADIFQALAQARPYREPLAPARVIAILEERAEAGRADATVVAAVAADLDACHRAALCAES
ncbi:MAG: HD domain-containing protein [Betaproteobacteria bacterium]|nr:HD domain-containing protein [Betaproteobacteria bacterium]